MWTDKLTEVFDYNKRCFSVFVREQLKLQGKKWIDAQETKCNHNILQLSVVNNIYIIIIISTLSSNSTKIKKKYMEKRGKVVLENENNFIPSR